MFICDFDLYKAEKDTQCMSKKVLFECVNMSNRHAKPGNLLKWLRNLKPKGELLGCL